MPYTPTLADAQEALQEANDTSQIKKPYTPTLADAEEALGEQKPSLAKDILSYPAAIASGIASGTRGLLNLPSNLVNEALRWSGSTVRAPTIPSIADLNQYYGLPTHNIIKGISSFAPSVVAGMPAAEALGVGSLAESMPVRAATGQQMVQGGIYGASQDQQDPLGRGVETGIASTTVPLALGGASRMVTTPFSALSNLRPTVAKMILPDLKSKAAEAVQRAYEPLKEEALNWDSVKNSANAADESLPNNVFSLPTLTGVESALPNEYQRSLQAIKNKYKRENADDLLLKSIDHQMNNTPNTFSDALTQKQVINQIPINWAARQSPETRMAQRAAGDMGNALDNYVRLNATTPEAQNFVNQWNSQRQKYGNLMKFYENPTPLGKFNKSLYNALESGDYNKYVEQFTPKKDEGNYKINKLSNLLENNNTNSNSIQNYMAAKDISKLPPGPPVGRLGRLASAGILGASLGHTAVPRAIGATLGMASEPAIERSLVEGLARPYVQTATPRSASQLANLGALPASLRNITNIPTSKVGAPLATVLNSLLLPSL